MNRPGKLYPGLVVGRLTLVRRESIWIESQGRKNTFWICDCSCGKTSLRINAAGLFKAVAGKPGTYSCKCLQKELISKRSRVHNETHYGKSSTPEYTTWCHMRRRCSSHASQDFFRYGGRGIKICERWNDYRLFLADMGRKPSPNHSIERIDNAGNYDPNNCRWASKSEQARNTRRNRVIEIDGVKKILVEWSEMSGVNGPVILRRLKMGWDAKRAVFEKVRKKCHSCT